MRLGVANAVKGGVKNRTHKSERPLRVLIAEDSARMRKSLHEVFSILPRLEIVGEAKDGVEALQAAHALKPDVITLDIHMPRLSGLEVLQRIQKDKCIVIVLSALADEPYRERCRQLKADHFFDKITEFDQFVELMKTL